MLSGDFFDIPISTEVGLGGEVVQSTKDFVIDGPLKYDFVSLDYNYYYY